MQVAKYVWSKRKAWLAPLLICCAIFLVLFILAGGSIDIPFLYRSDR